MQPPRTTARPVARLRGRRLLAYFALLVAAFVIVAVAASAYVFVQSDRDGRESAERDARFAARTGAKQLGNAVVALQTSVKGLAASPNVGDSLTAPEDCVLQFDSGGVSSGHIEILRDDGTVACSSRVPEGDAALPGYEGASWLRRARARELVEAPVMDAATKAQALLVTSPIEGGVVAVFLALEPLGPDFARLYGGGSSVEFVVTSRDRQTVLARSIAPERWVGESIGRTGFRQASAEVQRPDLDGEERLYADAEVPGVGWQFSAGEDKEAALAAGNRLRNRQLAIILAGLLLVLAAAFAVYRRVAVPVARLGAAVRSSTEQSPPTPVPVSGPAEVAALGDDVNGLIAAVTRELAERRRAEESAVVSERNYRMLFERSPLPMWIYDLETLAVLEVNDAALAVYGYSRDAFLALTMREIAAPDAAGESAATGTTRHRRHDGSELEVRTLSHGVTFGERPARFVLAEDVGERERLEGQLRQAQRMEAIGRLAGGVAHDFNNLLTAVIGYSELLITRMPDGDPRRGEAEEIKKAGERAAALTRQLLTFGRTQALEHVVLDVNDAITGIEPMLRRLIRSHVSIETRLAPDAGRVLADRGQIEQVLVNLVVNAGDAMPDGGRLTIATSTVELDADYFREHPAADGEPGRYTMLEVADTGVGMDAETIAHIFEPFYTTKGNDRGTGLGLATVYGIVSQSGGFLWVYSEPGRGTTFKTYLPVAEAAVTEQREPERAAPLSAQGRTVLLVEDDAGVRAVVRRMLDAHGFATQEASAGEEALALSDSGAPGSLTLLVTDTIVPGPGGVELADRIRQRHPALRTVIMSGYSEPTLTAGQTLGPRTEFIAKPFTAADLHAKLAALLAEPDPTEDRDRSE